MFHGKHRPSFVLKRSSTADWWFVASPAHRLSTAFRASHDRSSSVVAPGNQPREHQGFDPLLAQSVVDSLNDEPYYPAGSTDVMAAPPVDLEYEPGHVPAGATPSAQLQVPHMPPS